MWPVCKFEALKQIVELKQGEDPLLPTDWYACLEPTHYVHATLLK